MKHPLIFQVSLAGLLSAPLPNALAQVEQTESNAEPLDEAFLLFLAEGMEVYGEWKDPMTLADLSDLEQIPSEEIAWVAEQDRTELETMTQDLVDSRSTDGDENE